jgi:hypothetical protein
MMRKKLKQLSNLQDLNVSLTSKVFSKVKKLFKKNYSRIFKYGTEK